jgi:hypothetical protein
VFARLLTPYSAEKTPASTSDKDAKNEPNSPEKQEVIMDEMLSKVEHPFSPSQV